MISQFAGEYTSKTSFPQNSHTDSMPHPDQSPPGQPLHSGAPPPTSPAALAAETALNQNPVLTKLLMADQDAPLDLTVKKPPAESSEQDGVLDLSIKKKHYSSNRPVHSPLLSPALSMLKSESQDFQVTKDLQSTSTLRKFMAKLCLHHQRQIVDAIGFLQMEVKAHSSTNAQKDSNKTSGSNGTASSTVMPEKSSPEVKLPNESTPKAEVHSLPSSYATNKIPEKALSLKTSLTASPVSGSNQPLGTPITNSADGEQSSPSDHAPLKMKIMTKNAAGKKVSCVLNASMSSQSDAMEENKCSLNSSSRAETQSARLSSSVRRHNQTSLTHQVKHREDLGHAKKTQANLISVHMTIPSDSARTARKTIRTSAEHQSRDCTAVVDPDLGHCDIVFIDKPITECFKEKRRGLVPRRNARKSTRGHMYSDEIWELKTVRTLAGRGNCPNPMPELITLVTPKQILSKPEGVPHVNMLFGGTCRETLDQQTPSAESNESILPEPGDGVVATASKVDNVVVEPSQTDQCQTKVPSGPSSPVKSPVENKETDLNADIEQEANVDSDTADGSNGIGQPPIEVAKETLAEPEKVIDQISEQTAAETGVEPLEKVITDATEPQKSDEQEKTKSILHQNSDPSAPIQVEENIEKGKEENTEDSQSQKLEPEAQVQQDNTEETEKVSVPNAVEQEIKEKEITAPEKNDGDLPLEIKDKEENHDVSLKTLDSLLKELPPWRRKKTSKIHQLPQSESNVVGYVNGRPVSSSDRSLRHRALSNPTSPSKSPVKSGQNVLNNSLVNSKLESDVEKKKGDESSPESSPIVTSLKGTIATQQVTDSSSDTSSTKVSPPSLRSKKNNRQKTIQRENDILPVLPVQPADLGLSVESKRQLRSSSQKQSGTSAPHISSSVVSTIPPSKLSTLILPPADQLPPLVLPDSLPVTKPSLGRPSKPPTSEESQQNIVPECPKTDVSAQPIEVTPEETQKKELAKGFETKHKLRSAKVVEECRKEEEEEKNQLDSQKPNSVENPSSVKSEVQTQSMPLRSRRSLQKDLEGNDTLIQKTNPELIEDISVSGEDTSNRPRRMPLRSESIKPEMSPQFVSQSQPANSKKSSLRSQRSLALPTSALTDTARQINLSNPVKTNKSQVKSLSGSVTTMPHSSPFFAPKHEPPKQMPNKFFEVLTGEGGQQLVSNLNLKYDKMQKGWVQLDKEGQPAVKYKNKADRQAAIWRSKRRTRKPKSLEQQKYSPVQMLFMKGFNLSSICRWFLESTETKSLVIVKKVNTRLPSETQLCFHSSSSASGTSQGVFPSIQAERLKKHLKKFAIASPVKSNAKSKKLIAKALEQVVNAVKGKERAEPTSNTQTLEKPCTSTKAHAQIPDSQKSSGKSKNPASARILRKYSNIREKMQVQQSTVRLKETSKMLQSKKMKTLAATKSAAKSNLKPSMKGKKLVGPGIKQVKESKLDKRKILAKTQSAKPSLQQKAVKAQASSKVTKDATKKELPKRVSQRLGLSKEPEPSPGDTSKNKVSSKKSEADKAEVEKCSPNKVNSVKIQAKECPQSAAEVKGMENGDNTLQQNADVKAQASPDQVLTRSQRKMEAAAPPSPSIPSKKATKSTVLKTIPPKAIKKAEEPALTRSGASTRSQAALLLPSATKAGTKRPQEPSVNPAKRTRTK
ncbi:uncharacterized protein FQA47_025143 [Oryzias melastigma]|nr:uncharacterized protein FQA47_025143 [Oryzias melastigma]